MAALIFVVSPFDTYVHTYIHTYIHTHIHTYIHTYIGFCKYRGLVLDASVLTENYGAQGSSIKRDPLNLPALCFGAHINPMAALIFVVC